MTANRIIAHVFLQPSLQQVDEVVIEQLVTDHPYFSAARLLLARKAFHQTGDLQNNAVKKALLYTNQQHYAYQLIKEDQVLQEVENRVAAVIPEDTLPETATTTAEPIPTDIHEMTATAEPIVTDIHEMTATAEPIVTDIHEMTATAEPIVTDISEAFAAAEPEAVDINDTITFAEPVAAEIQETPARVQTEAAIMTEAISIGDFEPADHHWATAPEAMIDTPPVPAATENEQAATTEEYREVSEPIKIFPMALPAEEETVLTFQPLYTDDYFAYKRLKNPGEADQLNEQGAEDMKSFTSWLRQMKDSFAGKTSKDWYHQQLHRIYEEDEEPEVSETVEKMAMDSITFNNDIVSETLADIWVRQRQYDNAIKIYQKLSLLNPDKNTYFAQKILELKSQKDKK